MAPAILPPQLGTRVENRALLVHSGLNWALQALSPEGRLCIGLAIVSLVGEHGCSKWRRCMEICTGMENRDRLPDTCRDVKVVAAYKPRESFRGRVVYGWEEMEAED